MDAVKPELAATGGVVVDGATLTLTYGELLDGSSTLAAGDFTVSGGDSARTVSNAAVSGSAVALTLDPAVEHGETGVTVSYTPGTNPIRDVAGNEAEALSRVPVSNETPDTTAPGVISLAISSNPGSDQAYAAEDCHRGDGQLQRDGGGDRDAAVEVESREQQSNGRLPERHGYGGVGVRL